MRIVKLCVSAAGGVLASVLMAGCGAGAGQGREPPTKIVVPPTPGEAWTLVPASDVGMDAATLAKAVSTLPEPRQHLLSGMIVLRHGKPVLEQYWNGFDKDTLHDMRSATKSITSLLVGIAIDKGMLASEASPMRQHLDAAYGGAPGLAHNIALKDLLTMSSGLACNDRDMSSPGNEEYMYPKADWVSFFVNLPAAVTAGKASYYCTAGVVTLGRIVSEASKQKIPEFSARYLFEPIGVSHVGWAEFDSKRQTDTGGHLHMRPRDMAKVGQLVLQGGKWNGVQLVSQEWIARSTSMHTMMDKTEQYGYLWWIRSFYVGVKAYKAHYARGNGGQYIIVIPELDIVAVFTGENYNTSAGEIAFEQLWKYVLPAVLNRAL